MEGNFSINGSENKLSFASEDTLLKLLRANGHVDVKEGCGEGLCGACVVLVDGVPMNSCQIFAAQAIGREITTVEGLGTIQNAHPIQEAFVDAGAVQCGFCTPGMVLVTSWLLSENPDPTEDEIKRALDGNLCRCTGYVKIIDAVKLAARRVKENA